MKSLSDLITYFGISLIFFYSITKILNFYGIGPSDYGIYVLWIVLIVIFILVLPSDYPKV